MHTFDVYPGHATLPTFGELLKTTQTRLASRTSEMGIQASIELQATLRIGHDAYGIAQLKERPFVWPTGDATYVWIEAIGIDGGCDVTYTHDHEEGDVIRDEIRHNRLLPDEFVDRCLSLGRRWTFRRSAGQPCVVALVYGYLAATLAELTDGFIYSDDGAWDRDLLPMLANEFYETYFRPEKTNAHAKWARECLQRIPLELNISTQSKLQ